MVMAMDGDGDGLGWGRRWPWMGNGVAPGDDALGHPSSSITLPG